MATIYLSSTYEDLKDYRKVVFDALRQAGYQVMAMEDYVATDRRPVDKCLADVARADIYVGLFAFRYGYIPPAEHGNPDSLSITELEFRHAEKLGKPCLTFVVSEDAPWPPKFIDGLKGERINRLREYLLREKTASFFSSPHQLASLVQAAVTRLSENFPGASSIVTEGVGSSSDIASVQGVGEAVTGSRSGGARESVSELKPQTLSEPTQFAQRAMFGWGSLIARALRIAPICIALGLGIFGSFTLARIGLSSLIPSLTLQTESRACGAVPGFGPEMVEVSGGTFKIGDFKGDGDSAERPLHEVSIRSFAIGICEVTFEEYDQFAKATGRKPPDDQGWGRGRQPVINVSWEDSVEYARWLSGQTGIRYRLPTEAEWEYAARSGGKDEVWAGTSTEAVLSEYAWYEVNSSDQSRPVGVEKTNGLGLYDMSGNVWEWIEDCWHNDYNGAPSDGRAWREENGGDCGGRVLRGGSWSFGPGPLSSSNRNWRNAGFRNDDIGFRLALDLN